MEHSPTSARETRDRQPLLDTESREQGCGKQGRKLTLTGKGGISNFMRLGVGLVVTFAYVTFGAAVMVWLEPNDFDWLAAMHFCAVTIMTVGYGDEVPHTPASKAFIVFFILCWISGITTVAGSYIASVVRQWHHSSPSLSKRPLQWDIAMHVLMVVVLLLVGSVAFMFAEGETFLNSFYWTVVTLATVGYGDYVQHSRESKLFGLFFILIGVVWFAAALSGIIRAMVEMQLLDRLNEVAEVGVTADLLVAMDANANGLVERHEFVLLALMQHGLVTPEDVQRMHVLFDSLDVDGNGVLTVSDVRDRVLAKKRS